MSLSYTATCTGCDLRHTSSKFEHCTVCHRTFGGTAAGDAHRVGPYSPSGQRRCLSDDEMTAAGLVSRVKANCNQPVWGGNYSES